MLEIIIFVLIIIVILISIIFNFISKMMKIMDLHSDDLESIVEIFSNIYQIDINFLNRINKLESNEKKKENGN